MSNNFNDVFWYIHKCIRQSLDELNSEDVWINKEMKIKKIQNLADGLNAMYGILVDYEDYSDEIQRCSVMLITEVMKLLRIGAIIELDVQYNSVKELLGCMRDVLNSFEFYKC